jgi:phospholipid/cholesterol/gamma-HCH transport system substrate-binding protein
METTMSHEIKVGIFALIGVVLFCISIILLGGDKFFFSRTYDLKVRMSQVQGLGKGSVVSLTGVPVGNVETIEFLPGEKDVEVTIRVQRAVQPKITEGSMASIKTQGALGDKYVYIEPGPLSAAPLKDGAQLPMDKTPDFLDIIASKGAEMGEIVEVIKEVHILFKNINNENRSARLMNNLVESSQELGKFLSEGRETFRLIRTDLVTPMGSVMRKLDNGQGTLGALINDPSLHNRLTNMLGSAPRNKFLKPLIRDSIQTNEEKK